MKYNLDRKYGFQIIKDKIATEFGFKTKKERMDNKIQNYNRTDVRNLNKLVADRQILISSLQSRINEIQKIINSYDKFLKYYDTILELAENEITKPASVIKFKLFSPNKEILAKANYKSLESVASAKKYSDIVVYLSSQLEKIKTSMPKALASKIIASKGKIVNQEIDYKNIYHNFILAQQMLVMGEIKELTVNINSFEEMDEIRNIILARRRKLDLIYNDLSFKLSSLQEQTRKNQFDIDMIEAVKESMRYSEEYIRAKASHDYLEEIRRK